MQIVNKSLRYLFLIALVTIPLSTIIDSTLWTSIGWITHVVETPIGIRLLDNLLMIIIFIIMIFKSRLNYSHVYDTSKLLSILLITISLVIIYSCLHHSYLIILVGLDSFLPIFLISLFLFLDEDENQFFHNKIVLFLICFLYLNLTFQLFQSIKFAAFYGNSLFGLSQRTIGFFREPNTLALFNIVSFYFIYNYMRNSIYKNVIFVLLLLGIILSGSMAALLAVVLILLYLTTNMNIKTLGYLLIVLLICFYYVAPYIDTRPGLENSIIVRLNIAIDSFSWNSLLLSSNFGMGTNMACSLNLSNTPSESTLASNLINIGTFGTALFYMLFVGITNTKQGVLFFICFFMMSLSTIIYSTYPINLLFAFEMAYLIKKSNYQHEAHVIK